MIPWGALPQWLVVGLALGFACSLLSAGLFVLADRRYGPGREHRTRRGGENRRRRELREYLDAIGEQYAENHFIAGQHVAFYLPTRDVAITFDARAFYRIERTGTDAVLVEHEMPGRQLGARLPFEVPEVEFGADEQSADDEAGPEDPTSAAFARLGLPVTASLAEVKGAYRRKIKEVHPDQGGDEEQFKRVRQAYTTAKKHAD